MAEFSRDTTNQLMPAWEAASEFPPSNIVEEFKDRRIDEPAHFSEYKFRQDREALYVHHEPCNNIEIMPLYGSMRMLAEALEDHAVSCEKSRK